MGTVESTVYAVVIVSRYVLTVEERRMTQATRYRERCKIHHSFASHRIIRNQL